MPLGNHTQQYSALTPAILCRIAHRGLDVSQEMQNGRAAVLGTNRESTQTVFHWTQRADPQRRVRRGIGHYAGNLDRMLDMLVEFNAVALDLPGAAVLRGEIVFIGIFAFLKTSSERPRFLVGVFFRVLLRCQSGRARKHEQRNNPVSILRFIISLQKL